VCIEKLKEEAAKAKTDKKVTDSDPDGEKYVNTEKPLVEALKFIKPLELLTPESAEVNALGFEVYIRQNKLLLAVKALSKIAKAGKKTPCFESRMERFEKAYEAQQKELDSKIIQVIDSQLAEIRKL
jgi:peptide alpha-N-acetyltransferase